MLWRSAIIQLYDAENISLIFDFENIQVIDILTILLAATVNNCPDSLVFNTLVLRTPIIDPVQYINNCIEFCIDNIDGISKSTKWKLKSEFEQMKSIDDFPSCFRNLITQMGQTHVQ